MKKTAKKSRGGARPGAGRKRKYENPQVVSVKMPKPLAAKIDKHAANLGQSRNEVIVDALESHFRGS